MSRDIKKHRRPSTVGGVNYFILILGLEKKIYLQLLGDFGNSSDVWLRSVMDIAKLDCILSLAKASMLMDEPKCRPDVFDSEVGYFEARELRHPFTLKNSREFIANDILLDGRSKRIILLTGPNMGGKSTLLRQVRNSRQWFTDLVIYQIDLHSLYFCSNWLLRACPFMPAISGGEDLYTSRCE